MSIEDGPGDTLNPSESVDSEEVRNHDGDNVVDTTTVTMSSIRRRGGPQPTNLGPHRVSSMRVKRWINVWQRRNRRWRKPSSNHCRV